MPQFSKRSNEKEILDRDDIPFADILRNMDELNFINTHLGGHQISCAGVRHLLNYIRKDNVEPIVICEIGCGSGNNLVAIDKWCMANNIKASYIGIDINANCIQSANTGGLKQVELIVSDYRKVEFDEKPDIIFSSLFCHHFTDQELIEQLQWMQKNAAFGFFINDLQRHPLAYYSIKILTRFFSRSYLVKNDAPLSVLRGFHKKELEQILNKANLSNFNIRWKWAFRWLITFHHRQVHKQPHP